MQTARRAERAGVVHQPLREPHRAEEAGDVRDAQDSWLGVRRGKRAASGAQDRLQGALSTTIFACRWLRPLGVIGRVPFTR